MRKVRDTFAGAASQLHMPRHSCGNANSYYQTQKWCVCDWPDVGGKQQQGTYMCVNSEELLPWSVEDAGKGCDHSGNSSPTLPEKLARTGEKATDTTQQGLLPASGTSNKEKPRQPTVAQPWVSGTFTCYASLPASPRL